VGCLAFDEQLLVSGCSGAVVKLWSMDELRCRWAAPLPAPPSALRVPGRLPDARSSTAIARHYSQAHAPRARGPRALRVPAAQRHARVGRPGARRAQQLPHALPLRRARPLRASDHTPSSVPPAAVRTASIELADVPAAGWGPTAHRPPRTCARLFVPRMRAHPPHLVARLCRVAAQHECSCVHTVPYTLLCCYMLCVYVFACRRMA
jgi:hypothetical protein